MRDVAALLAGRSRWSHFKGDREHAGLIRAVVSVNRRATLTALCTAVHAMVEARLLAADLAGSSHCSNSPAPGWSVDLARAEHDHPPVEPPKPLEPELPRSRRV